MNFLGGFSKNPQNKKFHENPSSGNRVVPCGRTYGCTDGQTWRSQYSLFAILRTGLKSAVVNTVKRVISVAQTAYLHTQTYRMTEFLTDAFVVFKFRCRRMQGRIFTFLSTSFCKIIHLNTSILLKLTSIADTLLLRWILIFYISYNTFAYYCNFELQITKENNMAWTILT